MLVQANNLQMIVRAHECVMDGFERFAQGHLITLFSATNYCGTANNAGQSAPCIVTILSLWLCLHPTAVVAWQRTHTRVASRFQFLFVMLIIQGLDWSCPQPL